MRKLALFAAVLPLLACESTTEPLPPGAVQIEVGMLPQEIVVDERGMHVLVKEVRLMFDRPTLDGVPADQWRQDPMELRDSGNGRRAPWARWEASSGGTFEGMIEPRFDSRFHAEVSITLTGIYNGLLGTPELNYGGFVLPLEITLPIRFDVPADELAEKGARYRLVLDPGRWLYDEEADRLIALEQLIGRPPRADHPLVQRIVELARAQIRVERID